MGKRTKDKKERKAKRAKEDKDVSKRSISGFFIYNKERRERLKKEKPEIDDKEIIRIMTDEWNALTDEKKKPYIQKAKADIKRYEAEKKAYDAKKFEQKKSAKK